jgi:hypothetical protein
MEGKVMTPLVGIVVRPARPFNLLEAVALTVRREQPVDADRHWL